MSAVEIARSRPSDGELKTVPSKAKRGRAASVELHRANRSEAHHRQCHLERRHPDRVARLATVHDDHEDPAVGELPDRGAWVPRRDLGDGERLVRAIDGLPVAHEHGPASDGIRDRRPARLEDEPKRQRRPDLRFGLQLGGGIPTRDEHRAPGGDAHRAVGRGRGDGSDEIGVRHRGGERRKRDGERAGNPRRRSTPIGREERDPVLPGGVVEHVERAPLTGAAPRAEEAHPAHVEGAVEARSPHSSAASSAVR